MIVRILNPQKRKKRKKKQSQKNTVIFNYMIIFLHSLSKNLFLKKEKGAKKRHKNKKTSEKEYKQSKGKSKAKASKYKLFFSCHKQNDLKQ